MAILRWSDLCAFSLACGWLGFMAAAQAGPEPARTAEAAADDLFRGCTREQPTPNDLVLKCGSRVVSFSSIPGASPDDLLAQMIQGLSASLHAKIEDTPVRLRVNGAELPAHRFVAKGPDGNTLMSSYFLARSIADGRAQFVHCLAVKSDPAALEACVPTIDHLLSKGPPGPQRPVAPMANLEELFGHKVDLPPDCDVTSGDGGAGGRVRCGDRLTLRWNPIPPTAGAAELDQFATELEKQFASKGGKVKRDGPKCRIRGVDGTCARLVVDQASGHYTFLLGSSPTTRDGKEQRFVMCGASEKDPTLKGYCSDLFSF